MFGILVAISLPDAQPFGWWPTEGADPQNSRRTLLTGKMTATPTRVWYAIQTRGYREPAVGDVDGDGRMEVIVTSNDTSVNSSNPALNCLDTVICYDAQTGAEKWRFVPDPAALPEDDSMWVQFQNNATLVDIDGDGQIEVLIRAHIPKRMVYTYYGGVFCLSGNSGTEEWHYYGSGFGWAYGDITVADFDGDGQLEAASVVCHDLVVLDSQGNPEFSVPAYTDAWVAADDPDSDGVWQLYFMKTYYPPDVDTLVCVNGSDGSVLWKMTTGSAFLSIVSGGGFVLGDVDGDGVKEIVMTVYDEYTDSVMLWSVDQFTGTVESKFTLPYTFALVSHHVCVDVDADGVEEVVAPRYQARPVECVDMADSALLWEFLIAPEEIWEGAAAGDVNGDGIYEVLIGCEPATVYALSASTGALLWSVSLPDADGQTWPVLADIDGDSCVELVATAASYWRPGAVVQALAVFDDLSGTGCGLLSVDSPEESRNGFPFLAATPQGLIVRLPSKLRVSLKVYDASGRLRATLIDGLAEPGEREFSPELPKGAYLAVLKWPGGKKSVCFVR